jgi:hypothetical protein
MIGEATPRSIERARPFTGGYTAITGRVGQSNPLQEGVSREGSE